MAPIKISTAVVAGCRSPCTQAGAPGILAEKQKAIHSGIPPINIPKEKNPIFFKLITPLILIPTMKAMGQDIQNKNDPTKPSATPAIIRYELGIAFLLSIFSPLQCVSYRKY